MISLNMFRITAAIAPAQQGWPGGHGCLIGLLALLLAHAPTADLQAGQTPHPAVCRVFAREGNSISLGSGTLVAVRDKYGIVVTNWHVVHEAPDHVSVEFPDGFQSRARVLKMDRVWDLAALLIWRPKAAPVPLSSTAPRPGEALMIAGYGAGSYRAAEGRCTGYAAPGGNNPSHFVDVSVPARQGDSGGPIFNSRGELAGVLFGATRSSTTGSYVGRVRWFLDTINLQWPDDGEKIAAREQPKRTEPVEPTPPRAPPQTPITAPKEQSPAGAPVSQQPIAAVNSNDAPREITWRDIAGTSLFEQAKTVLAAIGLLTLVVLLLRASK